MSLWLCIVNGFITVEARAQLDDSVRCHRLQFISYEAQKFIDDKTFLNTRSIIAHPPLPTLSTGMTRTRTTTHDHEIGYIGGYYDDW